MNQVPAFGRAWQILGDPKADEFICNLVHESQNGPVTSSVHIGSIEVPLHYVVNYFGPLLDNTVHTSAYINARQTYKYYGNTGEHVLNHKLATVRGYRYWPQNGTFQCPECGVISFNSKHVDNHHTPGCGLIPADLIKAEGPQAIEGIVISPAGHSEPEVPTQITNHEVPIEVVSNEVLTPQGETEESWLTQEHIVETITTAYDCTTVRTDRTIRQLGGGVNWEVRRRRVRRKTPISGGKKILVQSVQLDQLVAEVLGICVTSQIPLEVLDLPGFTQRKHRGARFLKVATRHEAEGETTGGPLSYNRKIDVAHGFARNLLRNPFLYQAIQPIQRGTIRSAWIRPGWSGMILRQCDVRDRYNFDWDENGICVVRGRGSTGMILNAMKTYPENEPITYYSGESSGSTRVAVLDETSRLFIKTFMPPEVAVDDNILKGISKMSLEQYRHAVLNSSGMRSLILSKKPEELALAELIKGIFQISPLTTPVSMRTIIPLFDDPFVDPSLATLAAEINRNAAMIGEVANTLQRLTGEMVNNKEMFNTLSNLTKRLSQTTAIDHAAAQRHLTAIGSQLRRGQIDVRCTTSSHVNFPSRRLSLDSLCDADGNLAIFSFVSMPGRIYDLAGSDVTMNGDTIQRIVGRYLNVDNEGVFVSAVEDYAAGSVSALTIPRPTQGGKHCFVRSTSENGQVIFGCLHDHHGEPCLTTRIQPCLDSLSFGPTTLSNRIRLDTRYKGKKLCPINGYCYLNFFVIALLTVPPDHVWKYLRVGVSNAVKKLGAWPPLREVLVTLVETFRGNAEVLDTPCPTMVVDHAGKKIHVLNMFGLKTVHHHTLAVSTIGQLINSFTVECTGDMLDYAVGGWSHNMCKAIQDPRFLVQMVRTDPKPFLESLLSPSAVRQMARVLENRHYYSRVVSMDERFVDLVIRMRTVGKNIQRMERTIQDLRFHCVQSDSFEGPLTRIDPELGERFRQLRISREQDLVEQLEVNIMDRVFSEEKNFLLIEQEASLMLDQGYEESLSWFALLVGYIYTAICALYSACGRGARFVWTFLHPVSLFTPVETFKGMLIRRAFTVGRYFFFGSVLDKFVGTLTPLLIVPLIALIMFFVSRIRKLRGRGVFGNDQFIAEPQAAQAQPRHLQILAWIAMFGFFLDTRWAQAAYETLNKFRTFYSILSSPTAEPQAGVSEIEEVLQDVNQFYTVELHQDPKEFFHDVCPGATFEGWLRSRSGLTRVGQLPQYGGTRLDVTRETIVEVADAIRSSNSTNFLIKGHVGCGKSTRLPAHIAAHGSVLICEPTRALATNVKESLLKVCGVDASIMMRGYSVTGRSNVTVSTYGYALNWLINNPSELSRFDYFQFDEVHQFDSNAIVLYNWLLNNHPTKKIYKTTATPHGQAPVLQSEKGVEIRTASACSLEVFAREQGTGMAHDVTGFGKVAIVFVASYRDVDRLSDELKKRNPHFGVIKADGRFLRNIVSLESKVTAEKGDFIFVVATNSIENGVTLTADVVVDFGFKIIGSIDHDNRALVTKRVPISAAERVQRLGRVGRFKPGVALKIGDGVDAESTIPDDVALEAALLSFAHGVVPCLINVDCSGFEKMTIPQIRTASNFELPLLFVSHFVGPTGSIPREVYNVFKSLLLRDCGLTIPEVYEISIYGNGWFTVDRYKTLGLIQQDEEAKGLLPYFCQQVSQATYHDLIVAVAASHNGAGSRLTLPPLDADKAILRISAEEDVRSVVLEYATSLLQENNEKLRRIKEMRAVGCANNLFSALNINFAEKQRTLQTKYEENIAALNRLKVQAQNLIDNGDSGQLRNFLLANPELCSCVQTEGLTCDTVRETLLGEKSGVGSIPIICILMGLGCVSIAAYMFLMMRKQYAEEQAKIRYNRMKRSGHIDDEGDVYEAAGNQGDIEERFAKNYKARAKIARDRAGGVVKPIQANIGKAFYTLYDVDPEQFDSVTLYDPATQTKRKVTIEKGYGSFNLQQVIEDFTDEISGNSVNWGDTTEVVKATFEAEDKPEAYTINLTRHNPRRVNKTGPNLAGFPDKLGEWRQSGPTARTASMIAEPQGMFSPGPSPVKTIENAIARASCGSQIVNVVITDRHLVAPMHLAELQGDLFVKTGYGVFSFGSIKKLKVRQVDALDLVILDLPGDFLSLGSKVMFRPPKSGERVVLVTSTATKQGLLYEYSGEGVVTKDKDNKNGDFWVHHISTSKGHCGGPLVSITDRKIVGFHTHGVWHFGVVVKNLFAPVTDSMIKMMQGIDLGVKVDWVYNKDIINVGISSIDKTPIAFPFANWIHDIMSIAQPQGEIMGHHLGNNLDLMAGFDKTLTTRHVIKGKCLTFCDFVANHKNGTFSEKLGTRAPSILNGPAFVKDLMKYDQPIPVNQVDIKSFEKAFSRTVKVLEVAGFVRNSLKYVWNFEEVVNDMNWDAAMGCAYEGKKKDWFEAASLEELQAAHMDSIYRLYNGSMGLWTGSLKAELRPIEKVIEGKTRVYTSAPIDCLFGAKTLVDSFNHAFYSAHLQGPWTVGINPYNLGWERLYKKLDGHEAYIDADGSQYDSSLTPFVFNFVVKLRLEFMEDDDFAKTCLENLYTQIIHTPIVTIDGLVVQKHKGNNSGQPSTVVDNTLILIMAMEYMKVKLNVDDIDFVANGDDLLIGGSRVSIDKISAEGSLVFQELGMKYDFSSVHSDLKEVEYMSQRFHEYQGHIIPKLSEERILSILEWRRNDEFDKRVSAIAAAHLASFGYPDLMALIEEYAVHYGALMDQAVVLLARDKIESIYLADGTLPGELVIETQAGEMTDEEWAAMSSQERESWNSHSSNQRPVDAPINDDIWGRMTRQQQAAWNSHHPTEQRPLRAENGGPQDINEDQTQNQMVIFPPSKQNNALAGYSPSVIQQPMSVVKALINYTPAREAVAASVASFEGLNRWKEGIMKDCGWTAQQFDQIIPLWLVYTAENGTSEEMLTQEKWKAAEGTTQHLYDIKPFITHAKPTLRSIMRHFSAYTSAYLLMRARNEGYITTWGRNAGLTDPSFGHVAFDYWVPNNCTPRDLQAHHEMAHLHIGKKTRDALVTAKLNDGDTQRIMGTTTNDAMGGRRNLAGITYGGVV
ncbi:polyprotein [Longan witches broom-associated virus]|uniref:Genome polyprotein n=1 Tax=Longan witches broom-associated virus TaxID=1993907 RepID=A0A1X9ZM32_9POTY|nr:polyprotein [Longan witches broom-associated virus]ARS65734.1 polyprotein [Longan witches broom-associated virus]